MVTEIEVVPSPERCICDITGRYDKQTGELEGWTVIVCDNHQLDFQLDILRQEKFQSIWRATQPEHQRQRKTTEKEDKNEAQ